MPTETKMNRRDLYKFVELRKLLEEDAEKEMFNLSIEYLTDDLAYK